VPRRLDLTKTTSALLLAGSYGSEISTTDSEA
jgi:hypothetical protein